jgi:hypothetical protein
MAAALYEVLPQMELCPLLLAELFLQMTMVTHTATTQMPINIAVFFSMFFLLSLLDKGYYCEQNGECVQHHVDDCDIALREVAIEKRKGDFVLTRFPYGLFDDLLELGVTADADATRFVIADRREVTLDIVVRHAHAIGSRVVVSI